MANMDRPKHPNQYLSNEPQVILNNNIKYSGYVSIEKIYVKMVSSGLWKEWKGWEAMLERQSIHLINSFNK